MFKSYLYLRMCTRIQAYVRALITHVYVYLRMCTGIYTCLRVSTNMYVYLRMCTCIYACLRVPTNVYVYLRMCKCIHVDLAMWIIIPRTGDIVFTLTVCPSETLLVAFCAANSS